MKSFTDKAKYIRMYNVPRDKSITRFTLFDKYLYYDAVYCRILTNINKFSIFNFAIQQVKDISSSAELGLLLAINPTKGKDILFAAWCCGYIGKYFNKGKTFKALYNLCLREPDIITKISQDPDFVDIVKIAVDDKYFDFINGLF